MLKVSVINMGGEDLTAQISTATRIEQDQTILTVSYGLLQPYAKEIHYEKIDKD